jgi:ABC-type nitrate/sulfonate/bicarbonate transport system substrate-binding protein
MVHAGDKATIRVGYVPLMIQLPLVVSYENDRMNLNDVQLDLTKYNSFTSLEAALRVGAIDVASIPVPVCFSIAADGHKIRILGTIHSGGSRLVTKTTGGLDSVRGKVIGGPGLDSNENLVLSRVLEDTSLRTGMDYKTIGISFTTIIEDLKASKVDGFYLPEPFGSLAEEDHIGFPVEGQENLLTGTMGTVLVIRSEFFENNSAAVEEWLESVVNACTSIEKDIRNSGARQTAIIQSSYFGFTREITTQSLVNRKGDLKFDAFIPDLNEMNTYLEMASKMKLIVKSVDLDALVFLDSMRDVTGGGNGK